MEHPAQFQQLFSEFQQTYLTAEGFADLAKYIEIRNNAYHNIVYLGEQMAEGVDCTDLILRKLLPYTDTANNRWLGAWTHVAAAVPGDIRRWYGAAGRTGKEDWPVVAEAIWQFVSRATQISQSQISQSQISQSQISQSQISQSQISQSQISQSQISQSPEPQYAASYDELVATCAEFTQLAVTRGFQMGMMTPILNALCPDHFHLVNNRTRHVLQYFAGRNYGATLVDYPEVNQNIDEFLAAVTELIPAFDESGTYPGDIFERFCYWLTMVRRYSLRPARYWLLAAGEDGWQWEEWKDGGFVAVGWDELGDLSEIRKSEFTARRDSLLAQYSSWTKRGTDVAWRFAHQLQEGDQVAVLFDEQYLLGYGTVTGGYYYAPELPHGHRIPMQWGNIQGRMLPAEIDGTKPLLELTVEQFQQIEESDIPWESVTTPESSQSTPAFVEHFAPILSTLRRLPDGTSTAGLVREMLGPPDDGHGEEPTKNDSETALGEWQGRKGSSGNSPWSIHRARHYLSKAGLIESPRRGQWQVTAYGQAISLDAAEMERIYQEVEYHRRVEESLLHESSIIRRLTESSTSYTVGGSEPLVAWHEATLQNINGTAPESDPRDHRDAIPDAGNGPLRGGPKQIFFRSMLDQPYSLAECAQETGFSVTELERWVRTLLRKRQIVLSGPSGTGKTYMAHHLVRHLCGGTDGFGELVQFHPGYAYEDFVQGLRPNVASNFSYGENGAKAKDRVSNRSSETSRNAPPFIMKPGRFLDFCQRATECQGPAVLIIDEINRANLARVFGELMFLLEYRDAEAILAGNGVRFRIPQNVYLIGTMNSADRSIARIDHALRRRFGFINLTPNYDVLRYYHERHKTDVDVEPLIRLLAQINQSIANPHHALGITYFLTPTLALDLQDIWQTEIEPTLAERFFDMPERMEQFSWQAIGNVIG